MNDRIAKVLFVLSCVFFVFLYGFLAATWRWFPHSFLSPAIEQFGGLTQPVAVDPEHHKFPVQHSLVGARTNARTASQQAASGNDIILLTSFWPDQNGAPGIRLIDRAGRTLHSWIVDVPALWPAPTRGGVDPRHRYVHGTWLLDNGDILFNVEYLGLLRMNARGDVAWRLDRRTHHSVHATERGDFWVGAMDLVPAAEAARRFPGLDAPLWEDKALLVSPNGNVLREVSVLQAVFDSPYRALLWTTHYAAREAPRLDLMHLNDVEELPAAMASEYPLFEPGDLLLSMRFLNLVLVLDPDNGRVKWAAPGQFIEQHDPDFIGGGWISVYDNRTDWTVDGSRFGGSRLVAIQPHTGAFRQIYPQPGSPAKHERPFYSLHGGKAQLLPNGHWIITESTAGRVFEIDASGSTVWEWVQQPEGDKVSEVLEGTRYALTPRAVQEWPKSNMR